VAGDPTSVAVLWSFGAYRTAFAGILAGPSLVIRPVRDGCVARGECTLSTVLDHSAAVLANPFVGIVLGLAIAAAFLWISRSSMRMVRPGAAEAGVALAAVSLFARLAVATLMLWGYKSIAPVGFKPFALAFAGGFLVLYTVELVRYAGLQKYRRPTAAVRE